MNERIQKLAAKAVTRFDRDMVGSMEPADSGRWVPFDNMEKFAELIVRELVSQLEVEGSDFYYNKNNNYGVITVKYFVSGDSNQMCGEEVQAEFHNEVKGTGRYRLNEKFVEHLMKQNFGVK